MRSAAGRAEQQQHSGGDDSEVDAIHVRQTMGPDIVPMLLQAHFYEENDDR
jgi:hypothetical protein